ncbi:MAG: hypothetical protein KC910_16100 [Candidatus Eremiobacteraeota bacterium]|nr:hypothetical protein [Candidatus Eremiobacteraeota bacterium]
MFGWGRAREGHRGTVVIVSLLLVMVIALIGRAAVGLDPGLLALSRRSANRTAARQAADSGLDYALHRLRENPGWHGDGDAVVVDTPALTVIEQTGNVIGLIRQPDGQVSQFRIRFNFQDGPAGGDGWNDPAPAQTIDNPYVSLNNMTSGNPVPLPRADGPGWSVSDSAVGPTSVPRRAVAVLVEGRAGKGLRGLTSADPNQAPRGPVSTAVVEAVYHVGLNQDVTSAALMAGSNIDLTVAQDGYALVSLYGAKEGDRPRLRAKGSVSVLHPDGTAGDLSMAKTEGEIGRNAGAPPGFVGNLRGQGATLVQENVGDGADFYNLQWDAVTKASPDPTESVHIPAGTYVVWDDNSIHYYDLGFEEYKTYMTDPANHADAGTSLTWGFPQIRDPANYAAFNRIVVWPEYDDTCQSIGFDHDTFVEPSTRGVTDFTVMPRGGAPFLPDDTNEVIPGAADSYTNNNVQVRVVQATLSAPGDVRILGRLVGSAGTITTEGSFRLATPYGRMQGTAETNYSEGGLNLYAKGDIDLSGYRAYANDFREISFRGLIYTWGDFHAYTGHPDVPTDRWNTSSFYGAVVAYGSEPGVGTPGSSGQGAISMMGSKINLWNNVGSVTDALDIAAAAAPQGIERAYYTVHQ